MNMNNSEEMCSKKKNRVYTYTKIWKIRITSVKISIFLNISALYKFFYERLKNTRMRTVNCSPEGGWALKIHCIQIDGTNWYWIFPNKLLQITHYFLYYEIYTAQKYSSASYSFFGRQIDCLLNWFGKFNYFGNIKLIL